MKTSSGPRHAIEEPETSTDLVERRRPGRMDNVSPELIPLLRGQVDPPDEPGFIPRQAPLRGEWMLWAAWLATLMLYGFVALGGWSWMFPTTPH